MFSGNVVFINSKRTEYEGKIYYKTEVVPSGQYKSVELSHDDKIYAQVQAANLKEGDGAKAEISIEQKKNYVKVTLVSIKKL